MRNRLKKKNEANIHFIQPYCTTKSLNCQYKQRQNVTYFLFFGNKFLYYRKKPHSSRHVNAVWYAFIKVLIAPTEI